MCNALCECLKCPAKVVCCCLECTTKLLCTVLCSGILLLVVIGLILYFTVFNHKSSSNPEHSTKTLMAAVSTVAPTSFRDFFNKTM